MFAQLQQLAQLHVLRRTPPVVDFGLPGSDCEMLFNSQVFLLIFLPLTVVVYFLLKKTGARSLPVAWLVAAGVVLLHLG